MFKPLRLVYLEVTPEKGPEALTSKNFLGELKKFGYDKEKAKDAIIDSALTRKGGYKLIKAEALVASGKIKTINDLNDASAYSLESQDIEAFLNQYGGDKYVRRLFSYGMNKMSRDFVAKKQNFESDRKKGGVFEGLKNYATFEDAFDAGFYKEEFAINLDAIIEKGLSVSEYRQRDERFGKLERKIKKIEAKGEKYPEQKLQELPKSEERKVDLPEIKRPEIQHGEVPEAQEKAPSSAAKEVEDKGKERKRKFEIALNELRGLGEAFRKSDEFILSMIKKYDVTEGDHNIFVVLDNGHYAPLADPANKDTYLEKFIASVVLKNYIPGSGRKFTDYGDDLLVTLLNKEAVGEFVENYEASGTERIEKLKTLRRILYTKAGEGTDPNGLHESVRAEAVAEADAKIPEAKQVEGYISPIRTALGRWKTFAHDLVRE